MKLSWPLDWWQCPRCGDERHVQRVEITTYGDPAPRYIDGLPYECEICGNDSWPARFQVASIMRASSYGPPVPTPDDILRAAGLRWAL